MSKANFPTKDARESYLQLVAVLDAYGIEQHSLSFNASNHPVLVFTAGGREHKLVLAGSPSDHRSSLNARATLVRILRASGVVPLSERPKVEEALNPYVAEADPELAAVSVDDAAEAEEPETAADQSEAEELAEDAEVEATADQPVFETAEPTQHDEPMPESVAAPEAEQWDETIVRFARGRQLLFEPMPQRSVLALTLDQDLIAEKNGKLIIDLYAETVRVLPEKQFDAVFRSAKKQTTTLADAVAHIIATPPAPEPPTPKPARQPTPEPAPRPAFQQPERQRAEARPEVRPRITPRFVPPPRPSTPTGVTGRVKGVGAQLGRLLVTMHFLHRSGERLIDTGMLSQHMPPRDTKSISSQLYFARQRGFVETEGFVPGHVRAYYYRLTSEGAAKAKSMGNAPFEIAGLRPPSMAAAE